jgi:hypothetical protein
MAKYGPRPQAGYYSKMYPNTKVRGFEDIMNNLNAQIALIENATTQGFFKAAAEIRRDTEKTSPITPLDLGNLRASWFVTSARSTQGDKWSGKFVNSSKNSTHKADASQMSADHANAIAESQAKWKASAKTRLKGVTMGYSANYAVYVHENLNANFRRKQPAMSGAKWFQSAVNRNSGKVLGIIAANVKLKK